jgi:hypothetical protein
MQAVETTTDLINIAFTDWERTRRAELEGVPRNSTIGEIASEAIRALGLPLRNFYQALFRGRQLNQAETLEELGIHTDDELELVPEVSAG